MRYCGNHGLAIALPHIYSKEECEHELKRLKIYCHLIQANPQSNSLLITI